MERHILKLSLIIEGATEKVSHLMKPLESIYDKNFCFDEKNVCLKHSINLLPLQSILSLFFNVSNLQQSVILCRLGYNGTAHFKIVIDYRGRHRKSITFNEVAGVNLPQKLLFCWTKMYFLKILLILKK